MNFIYEKKTLIFELIKKNKYKYITSAVLAIFICLICFKNLSLISTKTREIKFLYYFVYLLLGIVLILSFNLISKKRKDIAKLFLVCIIPLGIVYTILIPPGIVPDEWYHMRVTLSLTSQITGLEDDKIVMTKDEYELFSKFESTYASDKYRTYLVDTLFTKSNSEMIETEIGSVDMKNIFSYFPCVLGVLISRTIGLSPSFTFYLARILNFTLSIILMYFAIKKIPFGKVLLLTIAILPMTCQQICSLSYDSLLNAASFFCMAYGLNFVYKKDSNRKKDVLLYSLVSILLIAIKSAVYSFILLIPILSKYTYDEEKKKNIQFRMILITIFISLFVLISIGPILNFLIPNNANVNTGQNLVPWAGTPPYSLSFLLENKRYSLELFLNTFQYEGINWIKTGIGSMLGWLNISLSVWLIYGWLALIILSSLYDKVNMIYKRNKIILFFIDVIIILLIMLAMAIGWTPDGYDRIMGIQGRYFIPIVFSIFGLLFNTKIVLPEKLRNYYLFLLPVMSVITVCHLMWLVL